jgi:hypothetical protein
MRFSLNFSWNVKTYSSSIFKDFKDFSTNPDNYIWLYMFYDLLPKHWQSTTFKFLYFKGWNRIIFKSFYITR